jgi:hypothetical protein
VLPAILLPEIEISESGAGTAFDLGAFHSTPHLNLTLGITLIQQQHSLELSILGSEDGLTWQYPPLASFSQKFYCGTYKLLLDLEKRPNVRYLLPRWKLSRWAYSPAQPLFGLYLLIEPAHMEAFALGAA